MSKSSEALRQFCKKVERYHASKGQFIRIALESFLSNYDVGEFRVEFGDDVGVQFADDHSLPREFAVTIYPHSDESKSLPLLVCIEDALIKWVHDDVEANLWSYDPHFLVRYMGGNIKPKHLAEVQAKCCESCNELISAAIADMEGLVRKHITMNGYIGVLGGDPLVVRAYFIDSEEHPDIGDTHDDATVLVFSTPAQTYDWWNQLRTKQ